MTCAHEFQLHPLSEDYGVCSLCGDERSGEVKALRALEPLVDTLVEVVDLEHGGRLVFTRFEDGTAQLGIEDRGMSVRVPLLTERDLLAISVASGALCGEGTR